jgi:WhiB family transcriptional regulator, redox-sensing transcriptional regulator
MARIERCGTVERGLGLQLSKPEPWTEAALCAQVDPEAWYPEKGGSARDARRVCQECPVLSECLQYALDHDERFGVWAGTTPNERQKLQRARKKAALAEMLQGLEAAS